VEAVAAVFIAQFPHLNNKVVPISCAGLIKASDISRTAKFMSSPIIQTLAYNGPVRVRNFLSSTITDHGHLQKYFQCLTNACTSSSSSWSSLRKSGKLDKKNGPLTEIVRVQSAHLTGYNDALSSSLRDGPVCRQAAAFSSEGFSKGRSVLLIHGTKDNTMRSRYAPLIFSLLPPATRSRSKLIMLEGAGHDLTVSHGAEVVTAMLEFSKSKLLAKMDSWTLSLPTVTRFYILLTHTRTLHPPRTYLFDFLAGCIVCITQHVTP